MVNGRDLLDPENPATNIRIVEGGERKTIGTGYATFAEMPIQPKLPGNARMMCLMGTKEMSRNLQVNVKFNTRGAQLDWVNSLNLPTNRPTLYYYNDEVVDRDFLLTSDFGSHNMIQVGFVPEEPKGDIIIQVVDDMMW